MAYFASSVKVDWSVSHKELLDYAEKVAHSTKKTLKEHGLDEWKDLPLFAANGNQTTTLKGLPAERSKILLKDSISPRPLHKALVLLDAIDRHGNHRSTTLRSPLPCQFTRKPHQQSEIRAGGRRRENQI